jgi:hypothetical protein
MRTKRSSNYLRLAAALALVLSGSAASAQGMPTPPPPSASQCRDLISAFTTDPQSQGFRHALNANVAGCRDDGASALAAAVRRAKHVREPGFADAFRLNVAITRSPVVLEALLSVAEDRGAAPVMRIMAIEGALRQYSLSSAFDQGLDELAAHPVRYCVLGFVDHAYRYRYDAGLPTGIEHEIASRLGRLGQDTSSPESVRAAAACVADNITRIPRTP